MVAGFLSSVILGSKLFSSLCRRFQFFSSADFKVLLTRFFRISTFNFVTMRIANWILFFRVFIFVFRRNMASDSVLVSRARKIANFRRLFVSFEMFYHFEHFLEWWFFATSERVVCEKIRDKYFVAILSLSCDLFSFAVVFGHHILPDHGTIKIARRRWQLLNINLLKQLKTTFNRTH